MRRAILLAWAGVSGAIWAAPAPAQEVPGAGWVVLPVDQYRTLRDKAYPPEPAPTEPPVVATVTRVDYDLHVAGDTAQGTARLVFDVLAEGWVRIPVPGGLRVASVRLDGKPISLVGTTDGQPDTPHVLVSRRGRGLLALDIAVAVSGAAGTESLVLPAAGSAVTRATVTVPRDGVDVTLTGGLLADKTDGGRESRWLAYGDGRSPLQFSWRRKVEERRTSLPLRLRAALVEHVGYGEETAQLVTSVRLDVVQGQAGKVALQVPEGVAVNDVAGKNVADWDVKDGVLTVTFLDPVESAESVVVTGEARGPRDGRLHVPLLRLPAAERETGGVAVEVLGAGEVSGAETRGMDAADAADLAEGTAGRTWGLVSAFRYRAQEGAASRALVVSVARYTPQAVLMAAVEEAQYRVLLTDDGRTLVNARYAVRNNAQSFLIVTLPQGATLWSAAVHGRPVRPGRSAEGAMLLPLEKSKAGEEAPAFPVELVYLERGPAWAREGRTTLHLPALDLPVARTGVELHSPLGRRLWAEPGTFQAQSYRAPSSPALRTPAPAPVVTVTADADLETDRSSVQTFVDRLQKVGGGARTLAGARPIAVPFPEYGAWMFLAAELTKEGDAPEIALRYKPTKRGGRG
jgi:hypothetical protein